MKAAIRMPAQPLVAVTDIPIDLSAEYLSGGAAKGLPVTLRSQINKNASPHFADFDDYVFANGNVQTGIIHTEGFSEGMDRFAAKAASQRPCLYVLGLFPQRLRSRRRPADRPFVVESGTGSAAAKSGGGS